MLELAGLTVLAAENGEFGLKLYCDHTAKIDAVLLDMTMPTMGGIEVARQLRSIQPGLPIILMSGFSVVEATRQSTGLGIAGFLQKPFNLAELLTAIRNALGQ
jgi:DNA-binding NtrC family response regulator